MHQQVAQTTHSRGEGYLFTQRVPRTLPLLQVLIQQPLQGADAVSI